LVFQDSNGAINHSLSLGIVLNDSPGGKALVLSDLAEGKKGVGPDTLVRVRTRFGQAFIAAPENFSGSMQVTAKLYSPGNLVLETRQIRFE
jgi:hypothetical protein